MTGYAWLFLTAWILTTVLCAGYWHENTYLRDALDKLIEALQLITEDDDETAQQ